MACRKRGKNWFTTRLGAHSAAHPGSAKTNSPNLRSGPGKNGGVGDPAPQMKFYRTTRALPPPMTFSTSFFVAIEVSPGVVMASAPWAAP